MSQRWNKTKRWEGPVWRRRAQNRPTQRMFDQIIGRWINWAHVAALITRKCAWWTPVLLLPPVGKCRRLLCLWRDVRWLLFSSDRPWGVFGVCWRGRLGTDEAVDVVSVASGRRALSFLSLSLSRRSVTGAFFSLTSSPISFIQKSHTSHQNSVLFCKYIYFWKQNSFNPVRDDV